MTGSCSKRIIVIEPQGPQGSQGPQGPQGPAGTPGASTAFGQVSILAETAGSVAVPQGAAVPLSTSGPTGGGVTVVPNGLSVASAGNYLIDWSVTVEAIPLSSTFAFAAYSNGTSLPTTKRSVVVPASAQGQIGGSAVVSLPAGAVVTLRNEGSIPAVLTPALVPTVLASLVITRL
jgi:hypothetical protein